MAPDHLGAFWRPARLLPWKRAMWMANWRRVLEPGLLAVPYLPPPSRRWGFSTPTVVADSAMRHEFGWDGTYPD